MPEKDDEVKESRLWKTIELYAIKIAMGAGAAWGFMAVQGEFNRQHPLLSGHIQMSLVTIIVVALLFSAGKVWDFGTNKFTKNDK